MCGLDFEGGKRDPGKRAWPSGSWEVGKGARPCEARGRDGSEAFTCQGKPRIARRHQKPEETRKVLPCAFGGGVCHCQHLAFRLLDSRTVKEYVSVVLSHPAGGNELR